MKSVFTRTYRFLLSNSKILCMQYESNAICTYQAKKGTKIFTRLSAHPQTYTLIFFRWGSVTVLRTGTAPTKHAFCIVFRTCTSKLFWTSFWTGQDVERAVYGCDLEFRLDCVAIALPVFQLSLTPVLIDRPTPNKSSVVVFSVTTRELFAYRFGHGDCMQVVGWGQD